MLLDEMGGVRMIGRYAGHTGYRAGTLRELCGALEPHGDKAPRAGVEMMTFLTFLARCGVGGGQAPTAHWDNGHLAR